MADGERVTVAPGELAGPAYYVENAARLGWGAEHRPDVFKLALLKRAALGDLVLDVGCGPGVYAASLAEGSRRVVAYDFAHGLLSAVVRARPEVAAVCGTANVLPFRDRAFDTALLLSILEHGDDVRMLREAARVTRSRIIVQVPLTEPEELLAFGFLFSHWSDRSHLRTYTEADLRALADRAGCRLVEFVPAYHRDLTGLYLSALTVPRGVRAVVGLFLAMLRRFVAPHPAEGFAILEPR